MNNVGSCHMHSNDQPENKPPFKELQSTPDIINPQPRTLIFGYGWVGRHIHQYFTKADIYSSDLGFHDNQSQRFFPVEEVSAHRAGKNWDLGIVCVPTPRTGSGKCNTSIVEEIIKNWKDHIKLFVIKSTVEIGTTARLRNLHEIQVVFSPEYIGETVQHPMRKVDPETFIILGGSKQDTSFAAQCWKTVLNANAVIRQVTAETAELCKYMENSYLATKVTFCNEFYDIAKVFEVDFDELREIWLLDPRITRSHTFVYENNRGFGGKCLPKDLDALICSLNELGHDAGLLSYLVKRNEYFKQDMGNSSKESSEQ